MAIDQIPLTVKPRKTGYKHLPLLVVRKGECLSESGTIGDVTKIDWRNLPPVLVVGVNLMYLLHDLDARYRDDTNWQWRARAQDMEIGKLAVQQRTIVDYFGFQADRSRGHKENHYHYCLDAFCFYSNTFTLSPDETDTLQGLMQWALCVRNYCHDENLPIKSTASGLAAQYLRDSRFYPHSRRKVPGATNTNTRLALPGNHYELLVEPRPSMGYSALEIDQTRAHHYHAEHTSLPCANTLFAFGDFYDLKEICAADTHPDFVGLYYMRLSHPSGSGTHPRWSPITQQHTGTDEAYFVFSNEISHLRDLGYQFNGIIAGWGARQKDTGIAAYARHCQSQLDKHNNAHWLKPILLTTYGLLAVKPKVPSAVYRLASNGEPYVLFAGGYKSLHGLLVSHTNGQAIEPGIANVIHRGMIEAATRSESLGFGEWLESTGQRVLQVYADSIIIADNADKRLPVLPEPWRVKQVLTDYKPINVQAFTSIEKTRIPGGASRDDLIAHRAVTGKGAAPFKDRIEAVSGRSIKAAEQRRMGLEPARI